MRIFLLYTFILLCLAGQTEAQVYLDSTAKVEDRVQDLLERMTLEEKIGQMTQADRGHLDFSKELKSIYLGSLLSGCRQAP